MMNPIREPDEQLDQLAHSSIGAAIEVHSQLGPGYLESVYEEAMVVELGLRKLTVRRQVPLPLEYKGQKIGEHRLDLLVGDRLILELKAVHELAPIHKAQVISYLKAMNLNLALLINFNVVRLQAGVERIVLS